MTLMSLNFRHYLKNKRKYLDFDTVALPHVVHTVTTDYSSWNCAIILLAELAEMEGLHLVFLGIQPDYISKAPLQLGVAT